ncbi:Predicted arabinose efflux permease, MFS family [Paenibacillus sophorae]|uniref:Predicted arabinose efflux permease, MFS family n=2 Tax=Paenibacillus sophorae TaxID=1333845 RepID=A0A1H8KG53_9BACL|nr:MFS transporter [Paenibacillus sophorae]SEN91757.1 Predicted arabinose efflux permease, MFS family [Paenibacillus sophorae]
MKRILFTIIAMAINTNLSVPFFPLYATAFHLNSVIVTGLFVIYSTCLLPVLLIAGPLGDVWGNKKVVYIGLGLAILSTIFFAEATNISLLYLARALAGMASGAFMGTGTALLLQHSSQNQTAHALTLSSIVTMLGFGLGPAISGIIIQYSPLSPVKIPYQSMFIALSISMLLLASIRERRESTGNRRLFQISMGVPSSHRTLFWAFAAPSVFTAFALNGTVLALMPTFVRSVMHSTNFAVPGILLFILLSGGALAQLIPLPGDAFRRIQARVLLLLAGTWCMLMAGTLINSALLWLGKGIQAVGCGWTFQGSMKLTGSMAPVSERARLLSIFYIAAYSGMILPTLGVGILSFYWGLMPALLTFGAIVTSIGIVIVLNSIRLRMVTQAMKR